jgi:hypothetical protein
MGKLIFRKFVPKDARMDFWVRLGKDCDNNNIYKNLGPFKKFVSQFWRNEKRFSKNLPGTFFLEA